MKLGLMETLERRTLFSNVQAGDFGAIANDRRDDRQAVQAALDHMNHGDVLWLAPGQTDIDGQLLVPSGVMITGASRHRSTLSFHTASFQFGMILHGATDIRIRGLRLRGNSGLMVADGQTENVMILDNDMRWGGNGRFFSRVAFRGLYGNENLRIEDNFFHDSPNADRAIDLWDTVNTSYSYNDFFDVFDGGHIDGSRHINLKVVGNQGELFNRMGVEIQENGVRPPRGGNGYLIADNVFVDWKNPWIDSFGISFMPQGGKNAVVRDNYISLFAPGKTAPRGGYGAGGRAGYGLEVGISSGIVQNNTIVGPWVSAITVSMPKTVLKHNTHYGRSLWGSFSTEPGNNKLGHGTIKNAGNNEIEKDVRKAPAPPKLKK